MATPRLGRLAFVGRVPEIKDGMDFLFSHPVNQSGVLLITGPSGAGKSTFVKSLLERIYDRTPDSAILLQGTQEDEFTSSRIFDRLILSLWYPRKWHWDDPINIPAEIALHHHTRKTTKRDRLLEIIYSSIRSAAALVPVIGSVIKDAAPRSLSELTSRRDDASLLLFSHLRRISKKAHIFIAIDNAQYLSPQERGALVYFASTLPENVYLIIAERSDVAQPSLRNALIDERLVPREVSLKFFELDDIRSLLAETVALDEGELDRVARDCHLKTRGNLKEVEIYARSLVHLGGRFERTKELRPLLETVELLPRLSRSILTIACLFPAGIRLHYLRSVLRKISVGVAEDEVKSTLAELSAIGYLIINSSNGDLVRASHDRVIAAMRKIAQQDEVEDLRAEIIATFKEYASIDSSNADLEYLLHCLIGVLSIGELSENIDYLCRLIRLEWTKGNFSYIVSLERNVNEAVYGLLPERILRRVLDAYQKTSQFASGIALAERLWNVSVANRDLLDTFKAKFLVQLNRNKSALEILSRLDRTPETDIIRANILQILCRDDEAREIVEKIMGRKEKTLEDYIAIRNAAHLFPADVAEHCLYEAQRYFRRRGLKYYEATTLNNLAVVWAWRGDLTIARRALDEALTMYREIGSLDQCLTLINLGVVEAAHGNFAAAIDMFLDAQNYTARTVRISDLNLEANSIIAKVFNRMISSSAALAAYEELYNESVLQLDDDWTKAQFRANLRSLKLLDRGESEIEENIWMHPLIRRNGTSGVEVFCDLKDATRTYPFIFVLTPLWRY